MEHMIVFVAYFSALGLEAHGLQPVVYKIQTCTLIAEESDELQTEGQAGGIKLQ
jgi:hypothetical protein